MASFWSKSTNPWAIAEEGLYIVDSTPKSKGNFEPKASTPLSNEFYIFVKIQEHLVPEAKGLEKKIKKKDIGI